MEKQFQVFNVISVNEELEEEFHSFFNKYGLTPLFTNEHRTTPIKVTDLDLRSVVNEGGSYHKTLKEFADFLNMANDNKSFEEATFRIIHEARSFQALMKNISELLDFFKNEIDNDHMFNMWNIVWYETRFN